MLLYHWKSYFSGNQKNHITKTENVAFSTYSSPLQRHSRSNIEFLENFHCVLLCMPTYKDYQHNFCLT